MTVSSGSAAFANLGIDVFGPLRVNIELAILDGFKTMQENGIKSLELIAHSFFLGPQSFVDKNINEPHLQKTFNRGFQPDWTQIRLCSIGT